MSSTTNVSGATFAIVALVTTIFAELRSRCLLDEIPSIQLQCAQRKFRHAARCEEGEMIRDRFVAKIPSD